jgi:hypothetical protein
MKQLLLTFFFFFWIISTQANDLPFQSGEELKFDIHYKYGLLMLKGGTARKKIVGSSFNNDNSYYTTLDFKTTSFFDKIYKMRDTLSSHISENIQPLYHSRIIYEAGYQINEELFFNSFSKNYTEVRIRRESHQVLKFDTTLTSNNFGYDLLSVIHYVRLLDYSKMESQINNISIFFGKKNIKLTIRCEGQSIIERSETLKYNTYKIAVDFTDEVFNESKNAIEIWMSDDENRVPVKMRAKLSIGAAEAILVSYKNLKYPFKSEIKIPVRKN